MPGTPPPTEQEVAGLRKLWEKAKAIATALPTWLAIAAAAIPLIAAEAVKYLPDEVDAQITQWAGTAVALLGSAIFVLRRLSPVAPAERGILPQAQPGGAHLDAGLEADLGDELGHTSLE